MRSYNKNNLIGLIFSYRTCHALDAEIPLSHWCLRGGGQSEPHGIKRACPPTLPGQALTGRLPSEDVHMKDRPGFVFCLCHSAGDQSVFRALISKEKRGAYHSVFLKGLSGICPIKAHSPSQGR